MSYVKKRDNPDYKYPLSSKSRKNLTVRAHDSWSSLPLGTTNTTIRLPEVIRLYVKKLGTGWLRDAIVNAVIAEMKKNGDDHLIPKPVGFDKVSESVIEN